MLCRRKGQPSNKASLIVWLLRPSLQKMWDHSFPGEICLQGIDLRNLNHQIKRKCFCVKCILLELTGLLSFWFPHDQK